MMLCTGDTGIACLHTFPQPSETGPQGLGNGVSLLAHALQILQAGDACSLGRHCAQHSHPHEPQHGAVDQRANTCRV